MIKELKDILPEGEVRNTYRFNKYYGVRLPELRKHLCSYSY